MGALATTALTATTVPAQAQAIGDSDIVNFALNLEYLEAEFYLRAVTGTGLAATDVTGTVGTQGAVTGGSAVPFKTRQYASLAAAIAIDEQAHVKFLRAALGSAAVAEPRIDFTAAFTNLAIAAGLIVAGQTFNPFADEISFLLGAFIFEDVGVTAYGAASLISSKAILSYAASVLAVEAYHAGAIRANLYNIGGGAAVQAISNLRGQLSNASGGFSGDTGILKGNGQDIMLVPADSQAQTFRRTTTQVLSIVYGNTSGTGGGLFFPNGMNGTIK
jgi:hypothetical protein